MWVTLNDAFVSIVEHRDDKNLLIVRGRFKGDVDRFLGCRCEQETPNADYRFRAVVARVDVARRMYAQVNAISYPNFKDSIKAAFRRSLASRVWAMYADAQQERAKS